MRRSVTTFAVLAFAALLRFWNLAYPDVLVFDELYYVRDAYSQLVQGYPTAWPDDSPEFNAAVAESMRTDPAYVAHPPLGKWLISVGILLFGVETGWGWRFAAALAGLLTVAVTMRLAWRLTGNAWVAHASGVLLAVEGLHVTLSRVSLLDGFLALLVVTGALLLWRDDEWARRRLGKRATSRFGNIAFWRPWLFAAAFVFGLAAGVKWSGIASFGVLLVWVLARDARARVRHSTQWAGVGTLLQVIAVAIPVFVLACLAYLLTWAGWIFTSGGWGRDGASWVRALWDTHTGLFDWHLGLTEPHPFASHPLTWPLSLRPTGMHFEDLGGGVVSAISPLPNVLVTWGGVLALVFLLVVLMRAAASAGTANAIPDAATFIIVGYAAGWLLWVATVSRTAVFQFYLVVSSPFLVLGLALTLAVVSERVQMPGVQWGSATVEERRSAVALYLTATILLGLAFWPMWSGIPQPEWFRDLHLWLPGWR